MILPRVQVFTKTLMDRALQQQQQQSAAAAGASFKIIIICQLTTASVSFVASSVMVFMILKTEKRLSTPYRRIIFGLGMADIMWSLAMVTGPFFLPSGMPMSSWGMGNQGTCRASGFIIHLFYGLLPMYTCFLCFYYLCKLKYKMTNEQFARRFEWKGHIFVISFGVALSAVALALNTFHPGAFRTICVLATTPLGCRIYTQLVGECDAIIEARVNMVTLVSLSLRVLWLIVMIVIMSNLYWHVIATNRMHSGGSTISHNHDQIESIFPSNSNNSHDDSGSDSDSMEDSGEEARLSSFRPHGEEGEEHDREGPENEIAQAVLHQSTDPQSPIRTNLEYLSVLYRNETALQGALYALAYFVTHFPTLLFYAFVMTDKQPPKWVQVLPFVFAPLGGFFIMLVYTRPQIAYLRRNNPELSRFKGFWLVLKAGGEVPEEPNNGNHLSRGNLRARRRGRGYGRGRGRGRGLGRHPQQQPGYSGDESISTMQFGARNGPLIYEEEQDVVSSVVVMDGESRSIEEGNLNYNPESNWSHVEGGSKNGAEMMSMSVHAPAGTIEVQHNNQSSKVSSLDAPSSV